MMKTLYLTLLNTCFSDAYNLPSVASFTASKLLRDIKNNIDEFIYHESSLRYILYSGHDSTLSSVMTLLGKPLENQPPFASIIRLELLSENNNNTVRVSYNNEEQYLPQCNNKRCSWVQFEKILQQVR